MAESPLSHSFDEKMADFPLSQSFDEKMAENPLSQSFEEKMAESPLSQSFDDFPDEDYEQTGEHFFLFTLTWEIKTYN